MTQPQMDKAAIAIAIAVQDTVQYSASVLN